MAELSKEVLEIEQQIAEACGLRRPAGWLTSPLDRYAAAAVERKIRELTPELGQNIAKELRNARNAALEEAAKHCEIFEARHDGKFFAECIRGLKTTTTN